MERIDPPEARHHEARIVEPSRKARGEVVGDHEAGEHEEIVDEQEGVAQERALADRA